MNIVDLDRIGYYCRGLIWIGVDMIGPDWIQLDRTG